MKCPHCNHTSEAALLKCPACGEVYERAALETFEHLSYLLKWLDERARHGELKPDTYGQLRAEAEKQLKAARAALRLAPPVKPAVVPTPLPIPPAPVVAASPVSPQPRPIPPPAPVSDVEAIARALALCEAARSRIPGWFKAGAITSVGDVKLRHHLDSRIAELRAGLAGQKVTIEPPREERVNEFAIRSADVWAEAGHLSVVEARTLTDYLRRPAVKPTTPSPTLQPVPAHSSAAISPAPAVTALRPAAPAPVPPKPAAPARAVAPPPQPPVDWAKVWDRAWELVVSGALLRGLLYLGAFMIVISAIVLVVAFWKSFHPLLQIGFIAAVPLTFYAGGFLLRERLKIPVAGGVFTGIGALLVAVDFAAVYQLGGLRGLVDWRLYWLITSIVCTALYTFTAWRVRGEFFAYLSLIGLTSTTVALVSALNAPLEWRVAAITASGAAMMAAAGRLRRLPSTSWGDVAIASRRLPHLLLPISLFLIVLVPGRPEFGQMSAFLFASLGYGLMAESFPAILLVHASAWSSVGAILLGLRALALPAEWYAAALAALAPVYLLAGRAVRQRLTDFAPPRRGYQGALNLVGLGLVMVAVAAGLASLAVDVWAGVIAWTLASAVLAWCAYLFRQSRFAFFASALFIAPFTIAVAQWILDAAAPQWGAWLMAAWTALALAYLGLALLLRRAEKYVAWLNLWAHALMPLTVMGLLFNYVFSRREWFNTPTVIALGGVLAVYVVSALIHDGGRHPALSCWVSWLPADVRAEVFLWPIGFLIPVLAAIVWWGSVLDRTWFGAVLAGTALLYVGAGQLLAKRKAPYRFPPHVYAYLLAALGVLVAFNDRLALATTLYLTVAVFAALAAIYRREVEAALASALFLWPFHLSLQLINVTPHGFSLAYVLLAAFGYVPLGIVLRRIGRKFALPQYVIGYGLAALSLLASLPGRFGVYPLNVEWVSVAVPIIATGLQVFSVYHFHRMPFAWAAAIVFPIAFGQTLTLLRIPPEYDAAAWVGLAFAYMLAERGLVITVEIGSPFDKIRERSQGFRRPLGVGAVVLCLLGLVLTAPDTLFAFVGGQITNHQFLILPQIMAVTFVSLAARLYRSRLPLFAEPALAFAPVTLFFIGYGERLAGAPLTLAQYGLVWSALGMVHLAAAIWLDRRPVRYSHALYLGGYALAAFAAVWTLFDRSALLWTLGAAIITAAASALQTHFNRHHSWEELISILFGKNESPARSTARGAFIWAAAWPLPIWCVLLLQQLGVANGFYWLGFGVSALALLGLGVWLRRIERTYAWPLNTASHFFTALGLMISAPLTLRWLGGQFAVPGEPFSMTQLTVAGFIVLQIVAVVFYAASAWAFRWRFFAHVSAWMSFFPFTLAWMRFRPDLVSTQFALIWLGLAAALFVVGFALDRVRVRYAHGPYLFGYVLTGFALAWSTADRVINIYSLAAAIVIALVSHAGLHYGWHRSFDDLLDLVWRGRTQGRTEGRTQGSPLQRAAQTAFLFFAAYAFPAWLAQVMAYNNVSLAWRGLGLALAAPIYVAFGLAARRVRSEYTWPLYSAGYALTAIGAMVAFDNVLIAIYVLVLDAVVYAASAYIFRQPFWLYLSNALVPVVALLTLHYNESLTAPWVSGLFMGLAFLYFFIGQWFNRGRRPERSEAQPKDAAKVRPFALPFHSIGYVLSAAAMAVASSDRVLAIEVYSAGVVLYAISAWAFRESVFLYPAVWLAAVPYYLVMTLTSLPAEWHGLGWLPLIVACIAVGKFVFHQNPLGGFRASASRIWNAGDPTALPHAHTPVPFFTHPALPFYLLAYTLSVSMIVISQHTPITFTVALAAGAAVYFGSAGLFRRPAWLYPGLLAAHLALMSYFAIRPSGRPAEYISLPFLGFTWLAAAIGYIFSRRLPATRQTGSGKTTFTIGSWNLEFGSFPAIGHLVTPSWSQPFFLFTALDVAFWQWAALGRHETAIIVAAGFMLLLMLLAAFWQDAALAYLSLGFFLLATGYRLHWASLSLADSFAWIGGIGFGFYALARITERAAPASVWIKPLTRAAVFLTGLAVAVTLPFVVGRTLATAAALAFAGALYLTIAFRGRYYRLGYAAMAMLQLAWILILAFVKIAEPQLYAAPAGLYFAGMGYLERRRSRRLFAVVIESFGLAVLLIPTFIQSLNGGPEGLPYFVLLIAEGILVVWWGAARRIKVPFFVGLAASVLNVAGQIVVLFISDESQLTRWAIIGSAGLLLVTAAVFVERQRARLIAKAQEWREALETWE